MGRRPRKMEPIVLEKMEIPETPDGPGEDGNGVNAFIYRGEKMAEIQELYGRSGCCLKIIKGREGFKEDPKEHWWGPGTTKGSSIAVASHIQNIYHHHGLTPRVYATLLVEIDGKKYWAQLTEDMGHWEYERDKQEELMEKIKKIAKQYGIEVFDDGRDHNVVGGKYVDFQGFHLTEEYKKKLKDKLIGVANVGKWGPWMNYHTIKELDIGGGRDNEERIVKLGLDKIDFKGKTVLDVGCSEGFFCHYAYKMGAKRVLGIDLPGVVENLWELAS